MKNKSHNGSGNAADTILSANEFRFMQEALRGGVFDTHGLSCGCARRERILEETFDKLDEGELDDEDFGVDLDELVEKLAAMDGFQTARLIDNVNHCYFAEVMQLVEDVELEGEDDDDC